MEQTKALIMELLPYQSTLIKVRRESIPADHVFLSTAPAVPFRRWRARLAQILVLAELQVLDAPP